MAASPYSNLTFAHQADAVHVNPQLLSRLNALAASQHLTVNIFSGYRSNAYSASHGGFANDPHTKGLAVDAEVTVGGKTRLIGSVVPLALFKKYGLVSGNTANFYQGKPDPEHVQLPSSKPYTQSDTVMEPGVAPTAAPDTTTPATPATPPSPPAAAQPAATAPATQPAIDSEVGSTDPGITDLTSITSGPPNPDTTTPLALSPGTGDLTGGNGPISWLWQQIASQPGASADTLQYLQNAQLAVGV